MDFWPKMVINSTCSCSLSSDGSDLPEVFMSLGEACITYSSQNPWNFLVMKVIMIKEDDKCLSPFQLKSIPVTFL